MAALCRRSDLVFQRAGGRGKGGIEKPLRYAEVEDKV